MKLFTENWVDSINQESLLENPSFHEVAASLEALNGDTHTLLALELPSGPVVHVGGGPISFMSQVINGNSCWLAKGQKPGRQPLELVVGGQLSTFEAGAELSFKEAKDILSVFYHGNGVLTANVGWEVVA
jgi:hypothetical protein